MESIDKLRKTLKDCTKEAGVEPDKFDTYWITAKACNMLIDEIEAEIERDYMRLPVDADGVPWTLETESFVDDTGREVEFNGLQVDRKGRWKILNNCVWHDPSLCSHVKPRTLEDIVADAIQYGHNGITGDRIEGKVAEFCAEIRELLCFEIDEPDTIRNELEDNGLLGGEECEPTEEYTCNVCGQDLVACDIDVGPNGGAIELDPPILYNYCPNCGKAVKR